MVKAKKLAGWMASAALLGAVSSASGAWVQFTLPYNIDAVREVGGVIVGGLDAEARGLVTQSYAATQDTVDPAGLPDDGLFNTALGPIQLAPYNQNNALRLNPSNNPGSFGSSATFAVPVGPYDAIRLFGLATEGTAPVRVTFNYADSTSSIVNLSVLDWAADPVPMPAGVSYLIDGMDRQGSASVGFQDRDDFAIFIFDITPDSTRNLVGISLQNTGTFPIAAFFAASGNVIPEPGTMSLLMLGALLLAGRRRQRA